jgi:hypothetical protein
MIPHRMLSNDVAGSGLRDRVTACRKRLRENRVMLKAHAGAEEIFSEADPSLVGPQDQGAGDIAECSATLTPGAQVNRSSFAGGEQLEEQEVGIA